MSRDELSEDLVKWFSKQGVANVRNNGSGLTFRMNGCDLNVLFKAQGDRHVIVHVYPHYRMYEVDLGWSWDCEWGEVNREMVRNAVEDAVRWIQAGMPPRNGLVQKNGNEVVECGFMPEWKGWKDYFDYWDGFIRDWYGCKEQSQDPNALPSDPLTQSLNDERLFNGEDGASLCAYELPEPYCIEPGTVGGGTEFDPARVGLVVVSMNPGQPSLDDREGQKLERSKYYNCSGEKQTGFLIEDFDNVAKSGMRQPEVDDV